METVEEPQIARRFNPLRSVRRGLKAACRWTIGLGRGRTAAAFGRRRARRGAPPLASLSAAMLEPGNVLELGGDTFQGRHGESQHMQGPRSLSRLALWNPHQTSADETGRLGSVFPLVLRWPNNCAHGAHIPQQHARQLALQYHKHADDSLFGDHHHAHQLHHQGERQWSRHHHTAPRRSTDCSCGGVASGYPCDNHCSGGATITSTNQGSCSYSSPYSQTSYSDNGSGIEGNGHEGGGGDSVQHLLAVGSRQWGNGGWWDGRGLLRVKIYDFAVYADTAKAAHVLRGAGASASLEGPVATTSRRPSVDLASTTPNPSAIAIGSSDINSSGGGGGVSPAQRLVSPASGVGMSLTIRACRNLPLPLLSQEFERILQRRTEKAGGRADDPALRELLSYFSSAKLPPHLLVPGDPASLVSGAGAGPDAVAKGAAITFSRSPNGELVTEAGGRVLGRVRSPALTAALFDLYLGDHPVSKRAKAAAGAALLRIAEAYSSAERSGAGPRPSHKHSYSYRLQPGERLLCPRWAGRGDVEACMLEVS